jgi:hypothetical protein
VQQLQISPPIGSVDLLAIADFNFSSDFLIDIVVVIMNTQKYKDIKYPCWAIGINVKTGEVEIYSFVINEKDRDRAESDYKKILGENLLFKLQKKEPFNGW